MNLLVVVVLQVLPNALVQQDLIVITDLVQKISIIFNIDSTLEIERREIVIPLFVDIVHVFVLFSCRQRSVTFCHE